jgi:hypothetical protein
MKKKTNKEPLERFVHRYIPKTVRIPINELLKKLKLTPTNAVNQSLDIVLDQSNCFIDSSGHRIEFVKGWFDRKILPDIYPTYQNYVKRLVSRQSGKDDKTAYPVDLGMFIDKINEAETFINILKENFIELSKIDSVLDIGTGPAIIPRVLKMIGCAKRTVGIDILDRIRDYTDEMILNNIKDLRNQLLDGTRPYSLIPHLLRSHSFIPDNHPNALLFQPGLVEDFGLDSYYLFRKNMPPTFLDHLRDVFSL